MSTRTKPLPLCKNYQGLPKLAERLLGNTRLVWMCWGLLKKANSVVQLWMWLANNLPHWLLLCQTGRFFLDPFPWAIARLWSYAESDRWCRSLAATWPCQGQCLVERTAWFLLCSTCQDPALIFPTVPTCVPVKFINFQSMLFQTFQLRGRNGSSDACISFIVRAWLMSHPSHVVAFWG